MEIPRQPHHRHNSCDLMKNQESDTVGDRSIAQLVGVLLHEAWHALDDFVNAGSRCMIGNGALELKGAAGEIMGERPPKKLVEGHHIGSSCREKIESRKEVC
jgi:hypothetical protein